MPSRLLRVAVGFLAFLGIVGLAVFVGAFGPIPDSFRGGTESREVLAPHAVPPREGRMPLRFAMIHDVLHQRYPVHGDAWYRARLARDLARLRAVREERAGDWRLEDLTLFDDCAVAYDRLGEPGQGLALLEESGVILAEDFGPVPTGGGDPGAVLAARLAVPLAEPPDDPRLLAWYRFHANRGTLRAHRHLGAALAGDPAAAGHLDAAIADIAKAIAINPDAHMGREVWQLAALHHLRACLDRPELLTTHSLLGQPLYGLRIDVGATEIDPMGYVYPLKTPGYPPSTRADWPRADREIWEDLPTKIVFHDVWLSATGLASSLSADGDPASIPFDRPARAVIGMWIYGGGPNPHFALQLGRICEEVGQWRLAWSGYRRAEDLGARFAPDGDSRQRLLDHCRSRRDALVRHLADLEGTLPAKMERNLEGAYREELARGRGWQAARLAYEERRLAAGADLDDPDLFADFGAEHGRIATDPGRADHVTVSRRSRSLAIRSEWVALSALFGVGVAAWSFLGLYLRRRYRCRREAARGPG